MKSLSELGMMDVASSSRSRPVWRFGAILSLCILGIVIARNYFFVLAGMLGPDFEVIHQAYDFNLWQLPWGLAVISGFFGLVALFYKSAGRALFCLAGLYAFVAVDLFVLRYYVTYVEPERLVVHTIRLETPKLKAPVRILHISDIQAGAIEAYQVEIFERIKELQPDLILNTGDFLQVVAPATFEQEWAKLLGLMREVNPRYGTYAVFGDTEYELYRIRPEAIEPLQMLSSQNTTIEVGGGRLSLHGLSLYESKSVEWAQRSVESWLGAASVETDFRILFGHSPNYATGMHEQLIDLCLAGHTHGGQVALPFYGPLVIDSDIPRAWARGFRRIGIPYLNVSAGAGSNRRHGLPPLRFNCPTEMTLIELVPLN
jgi:predicted MPP superfamily phosphohydrolase